LASGPFCRAIIHITPRFSQTEVAEGVAPLHAEIARLHQAPAQATAPALRKRADGAGQ